MAGFSPYFKLCFFDFGDKLDYSINVQREIDRFVLIDRQLQGLYNIYGNGVISGWNTFDNGFSTTGGISIAITTGTGVINSISSQTSATMILSGLQPSSTFGVYAYNAGASVTDRSTQFYVGATAPNPTSILISRVITSDSGVSSIDDSVRTYIDFEQVVVDLINNHKHRGTPPKVDLSTETKNELSGARIDSFSAEKITSGRIIESCAPIINHSDLSNIGVLTHAQLESLSDTIIAYNSNNDISYKELMGEVALTNLLQQTIFLKYMYSDIDKFFNNEFIIIPEIPPSFSPSYSALIDEENSTTFVDYEDQRIVGLPLSDESPTYFFTKNIVLPSEAKDIILTSNKSIPVNSSIVFGINTTNSINFDDYQIVNESKVELVNYNGIGLRIGIKFDYTGAIDPYDSATFTFEDYIDFSFINDTIYTYNFHFRIQWYTDAGWSHLFYETDSVSDQDKWIVNDLYPVPPEGYSVAPGEDIIVSYFPDTLTFASYQTYYIRISVSSDGGSTWTNEIPTYTYFTTKGSGTADPYSFLPQVYNFGVMFSLLDNSKVQVNT